MHVASEPAGAIACGIAGWSYPDWNGYVYPAGVRDKLQYVANFVDCIEINSSFYRPPTPRTAASWLRRVRHLPDFYFTAKIHQDVTHHGRLDPSTVTAFHESFGPLAKEGRLRHLLAQFRYDFADTPGARRHLERTADAFEGIAHLTLEVRHRSWEGPEALAYLQSLGVGLANLDYPLARDSFAMPVTNVGDHAYLRLHGRNASAWFSKAGRDETYNYLYSQDELKDIAARARKIASLSQSLTLIANNHYRGKEAVNALQLKAMLAGEPVEMPASLRIRYPELASIARPGPASDLFESEE